MWQQISSNSERLQVPGGWIVRSRFAVTYGAAITQTFIVDPEHTWVLEKPVE